MTTTTQGQIDRQIESAALSAGIIDVDALKLADHSLVTTNAAGQVEGIEKMLAQLKRSKPHLFKKHFRHMTAEERRDGLAALRVAGSRRPPAPSKHARDMTDTEYQAAKAAIGLRHTSSAFSRRD